MCHVILICGPILSMPSSSCAFFFFFSVTASQYHLSRLVKHMVVLKDSTFRDIITFLNNAEQYGGDILTVIRQTKDEEVDVSKNNVSFEARQLKCLYLKIMGY